MAWEKNSLNQFQTSCVISEQFRDLCNSSCIIEQVPENTRGKWRKVIPWYCIAHLLGDVTRGNFPRKLQRNDDELKAVLVGEGMLSS